jgi:hypothetical protein
VERYLQNVLMVYLHWVDHFLVDPNLVDPNLVDPTMDDLSLGDRN